MTINDRRNRCRGTVSTTHRRAELSHAQFAFNYRYFVDLAAASGGRVLDYGCGIGQTVTLGRARGLDVWGADTFTGFWAPWVDLVKPDVRDRIRSIENDRTDYPDDHFDIVMSNQVLEHVTDPEAVIADIHRMVKPGGYFIAAFPVIETWYEGHVGLYFAHRLKPGSPLRRIYFDLCHRLGFGLYRNAVKTRQEWVQMSETMLDKSCFYYPHRRLISAIKNSFGGPIEDLSVDYMRARLGSRARHIPSALLRFIYHKRAGEIVRVRKSR
jgi:SAM-dependent methyltransferase